MTNKQLEELKDIIREAKNAPVLKACCLTCDYCILFRGAVVRGRCAYHKYDLSSVYNNVCFFYRPLRDQ